MNELVYFRQNFDFKIRRGNGKLKEKMIQVIKG